MSLPWSELGLSGPADLAAIKHAYAQRLKTTHPEENPEGFQRLHSAYQTARRLSQPPRTAKKETGETLQTNTTPQPPLEQEEFKPQCTAATPPPEEPPEEASWDFDTLLTGAKPPPGKPPEEASWDFDTLLTGAKPPPEEPPKEASWDFDTLISKGESERAEAQQRRVHARRLAEAQEQYAHTKKENETWAAVAGALHALEVLHTSDAPLSAWNAFLRSLVFRNVKNNIDFLFGLEDFLNIHKSLSQEIKSALFLSYGLERGAEKPLYRPLFRLLFGSYYALKKKTKMRNIKYVLVVLLLALICVLLFLPRNQKPTAPVVLAPNEAVQLCAYLEEDFGESFTFLSELEEYQGVYNLKGTDTQVLFWASLQGSRDKATGNLGYTTNYTGLLFYRALKDFAEQQDCKLIFQTDQTEPTKTPSNKPRTPETYHLSLPLVDAEDTITALDTFLETLPQSSWYPILPPKITLTLHHGDLILHRYDSTSDAEFDGPYVLERYQDFGAAFARYLVEEYGAIKYHLGDNAVLQEQGIVPVDGASYYLIDGLRAPSATEVDLKYYVSLDGTTIYVRLLEDAPWPDNFDDFIQWEEHLLFGGTKVYVYY